MQKSQPANILIWLNKIIDNICLWLPVCVWDSSIHVSLSTSRAPRIQSCRVEIICGSVGYGLRLHYWIVWQVGPCLVFRYEQFSSNFLFGLNEIIDKICENLDCASQAYPRMLCAFGIPVFRVLSAVVYVCITPSVGPCFQSFDMKSFRRPICGATYAVGRPFKSGSRTYFGSSEH